MPGIVRSSRTMSGCSERGFGDRRSAVLGSADDVEALLREQRREGVSRQRMVVDDEDALGHAALIGRSRRADKWNRGSRSRLRATDRGCSGRSCSSACSPRAPRSSRRTTRSSPSTSSTMRDSPSTPPSPSSPDSSACSRASASSSRAARSTCCSRPASWSIALGTIAFGLVPVLGGGTLTSSPPRGTFVGARLLGAGLIAVAPYVERRLRRAAARLWPSAQALSSASSWSRARARRTQAARNGLERSGLVRRARMFGSRPRCSRRSGSSRLVGLRAALPTLRPRPRQLDVPRRDPRALRRPPPRPHADRLERLRPAGRLPPASSPTGSCSSGVWRAISDAEFGRAVADERARVAREIHDGLAQYLFAISTQVSMLESGAPLDAGAPSPEAALRRRRNRRRASRCSRCRRLVARRASTRRSGGTSRF